MQAIPDEDDEQRRDVQQIEVNPRIVKQEGFHASALLIASRDTFKKPPVYRLAALCCNS
jgi:hypothetical protein